MKALQKFRKIEADATLSTLCEFSVLGQTTLPASLQNVKYAVTLFCTFLFGGLDSFHHSSSSSFYFSQLLDGGSVFVFLPLSATTVDSK